MRIQSLDKQFIEYTYIENRNHNAIADRFVRNTTIALDFLVRTSVLTISFKEDDILQRFDVIDILVADTTNNITIVPSNKNAYSPKYNTILFYDTHGVVFRKNHKKRSLL